MSYGINIKNENSCVQVDGDNQNMFLVEKGTTTLSAGATWYGYLETNFVDVKLPKFPLLAFKAMPDDADGFMHIVPAGLVLSTDTFTIGKFLYRVATYPTTVDKTFSWAVFTNGPTSIQTGYGINIRNARGEICYGNNEGVLRLKAYKGTLNYLGDPYTDLSVDTQNYHDITVQDAVNNYFTLGPHTSCIEQGTMGVYSARCVMMFKRIDATTIRVAQVGISYLRSTWVYDYTVWSPNYTLLEIDGSKI